MARNIIYRRISPDPWEYKYGYLLYSTAICKLQHSFINNSCIGNINDAVYDKGTVEFFGQPLIFCRGYNGWPKAGSSTVVSNHCIQALYPTILLHSTNLSCWNNVLALPIVSFSALYIYSTNSRPCGICSSVWVFTISGRQALCQV